MTCVTSWLLWDIGLKSAFRSGVGVSRPPHTERMILPELEEGARLFNAGQWWEAHEAWEREWLTAQGEQRAFVQALILLAAALHKRWVQGSLTHRNYDKAQKYLGALPPRYGGVDLGVLNAEVWAALESPGRRPQLPVPPEPPT